LALRNEQTCTRLFDVAEVHSQSQGTLTETVTIVGNKLSMLSEARNRLTDAHTSLTDAHKHLTEEIAGYVADSREPMKQMEAGLDALIRIITAEHSNGEARL
jgi:hypothetical protein